MPQAGATVTGSLGADGRGTVFQPIANKPFNLFLTGSFTATATVQRSYDNGVTWLTVTKPDLTDAAFTAPINLVISEPEALCLYSVLVSGYGGGAVAYRFGQ